MQMIFFSFVVVFISVRFIVVKDKSDSAAVFMMITDDSKIRA